MTVVVDRRFRCGCGAIYTGLCICDDWADDLFCLCVLGFKCPFCGAVWTASKPPGFDTLSY